MDNKERQGATLDNRDVTERTESGYILHSVLTEVSANRSQFSDITHEAMQEEDLAEQQRANKRGTLETKLVSYDTPEKANRIKDIVEVKNKVRTEIAQLYEQSGAYQHTVTVVNRLFSDQPQIDANDVQFLSDAGEALVDITKKLIAKRHKITEKSTEVSETDNNAVQQIDAFMSTIIRGVAQNKDQSSTLIQRLIDEEREKLNGKKDPDPNKDVEGYLDRLARYKREHAALAVEKVKLEQELETPRRINREARTKLKRHSEPFPLQNNLFVTHAMNFLWDADFRNFLADATQIQEQFGKQKDKANELMQRAMQQILPKIETYYSYMYGRTDEYPVMATQRIYDPVLQLSA